MPEMISKTFDELSTRELYDILRLRSDVFVVEQNCVYQDVDGRDAEPTTMHHWFSRDGTLVAYLRVLRELDGTARIGRVVTAADARGDGVAASLVTAVSASIGGRLVLDAQSHLVGWYEQLGFLVDGPEFMHDDILHAPMRRA